ncbi:MAG: PAS domain S-box protein [Methanoregula sp.]
MTGKTREKVSTNYRQYFDLLSGTVEALNDLSPDADIWAFIAATLKQIVPEDTIILVNAFNPDTRTITLHAIEGLGQYQCEVETVIGRSLHGLSFSVPGQVIPFMLTGECNEIRGGLSELTFGWLPPAACKKIEAMPFFGRIFSAGISWKGKLKGAATFILPPGKDLENGDMVVFFMRLVAGFLSRWEAEISLRESEERYRSFVQKFQGIAYQSTMNWIPVFFHGAVEAITGYTEQDFVTGKPRWDQVIYPEDLEEINRTDTEKLLTIPGYHRLREYRIIRKDGQLRWISDFIQNQPRDSEEPLLSGIITDISERKAIDEALRQKTAELEGFFSVAIDMLCIANTDGYFLVLNPAWERILGYDLDELKAKRFLEFVHPVDMKPTLDAIATLVNQKEVVNFVNRYRCKDGTYRWIEWRSAPAGNLIYAAARDITDRKLADLALAESEERFRLLYEKSMDAILLTSTDSSIQAANPAACAMFQRTEEELLKSGRSLVVDSTDPRLALALEERARTGRFEGELTFFRKDGSRFPGEISSSTFIDRSGNKRSSMIIRDVSGQKAAAEALIKARNELELRVRERTAALKSSERRLTDIISHLPDATLAIDREGTVIAWNRAMEEMTGVPAGQMLGKGDHEYALPFYGSRRPILIDEILAPKKELEKFYTGIQRQGDTIVAETDLVLPDGRSVSLWGKATPLHDEHGNRIGAIESIRDITERRKAEAALRESEEKFHAVVEAAQDGMLVADPETHRFVMANAAITKLTGYTEAELLSLSIPDIHRPADLPYIIGEFERQSRGEIDLSSEIPVLRKDKTIIYADINSSRVVLQGRECRLGIFRDVTERKLAREELQKLYNELEQRVIERTMELSRAQEAYRQANKKLNLLSGITRHDIRNQLLALEGYLEISKEYLGDPNRTAEFIAKEEKIADTIARQITFTKDYEDMGVKAPVWQKVHTVISEVITRLPVRNIRVDSGDPGLEIFADPLLEKVFYNLIDNALRYGGEQMTAILVSNREENGVLIIAVEDNGNGVSADDKTQLFTKGFGKHTGLGLFLSREILAITGITITENGVPGKGARFEMSVPKGAYRFKQ